MPSAHGGDNFIGSAIQTKGFGCILCSFRKRLIEWNTPRFNRRLVRVAKNPSTVFTHGHETDLLSILQALHDKGVGLLLHQQGLGTTSSAGKAMFQMLGVFAEFERAMTLERVYAGLKRARAEGKVLGRPKVNDATEDAIRAELAKGTGIKATARAVGCGVGTVQRVKAEQAA